jgi:CBS domain-containing protein
MKVADICTREVVATGRSTSVQQAAVMMRERHVGALVVLADSAQGAQVVGIVTDRDLVIEALARGLDAAQTEVGRFADGKLAAVSADASLDDAIAMMKKGVRRACSSPATAAALRHRHARRPARRDGARDVGDGARGARRHRARDCGAGAAPRRASGRGAHSRVFVRMKRPRCASRSSAPAPSAACWGASSGARARTSS